MINIFVVSLFIHPVSLTTKTIWGERKKKSCFLIVSHHLSVWMQPTSCTFFLYHVHTRSSGCSHKKERLFICPAWLFWSRKDSCLLFSLAADDSLMQSQTNTIFPSPTSAACSVLCKRLSMTSSQWITWLAPTSSWCLEDPQTLFPPLMRVSSPTTCQTTTSSCPPSCCQTQALTAAPPPT